MTSEKRRAIHEASERMFGSASMAAILTEMLARGGDFLSAKEVAFIEPSHRMTNTDPAPLGVVRICLLRKALGVSCISGVVETKRKHGYRIPVDRHAAIMERLGVTA